jgi:outer membrane protein assembly factor BamE (lipoprotein component of BamABCDE complex)
MKKSTFLLLIVSFIILGCQRNEVIKNHGISYLEKREKLITINKSNKNDTVEIFGQPSTKGMTDDNLWIYIERTNTRGNIIKLGKNKLKKNNVLVLEFSKYGILVDKKFYDKDNMNSLVFDKEITVNEIKKENFIYSFLSSVRQKMQQKRK